MGAKFEEHSNISGDILDSELNCLRGTIYVITFLIYIIQKNVSEYL